MGGGDAQFSCGSIYYLHCLTGVPYDSVLSSIFWRKKCVCVTTTSITIQITEKSASTGTHLNITVVARVRLHPKNIRRKNDPLHPPSTSTTTAKKVLHHSWSTPILFLLYSSYTGEAWFCVNPLEHKQEFAWDQQKKKRSSYHPPESCIIKTSHKTHAPPPKNSLRSASPTPYNPPPTTPATTGRHPQWKP